MPGYKSLQCDNLSHILHQILGNFFLFLFCLRFFVIDPGIIVLQFFLIQRIKLLLSHNRNPKFHSIKHGIVVILKQAAVVGKCHQAGNLPDSFSAPERISHRQIVVVCIHSVNGNLSCPGRQLSLHQADLVHLLPVFKKTHGASIIQRFLHIIIIIQLHTQRLYFFSLGFVDLLCCAKVSVFYVVLLKTFIVSNKHTVICN